MVDKTFLNWLKSWIGPRGFSQIAEDKLRPGSQLMNVFETLKHQFSGNDEEMLISLPRECGIEDDLNLNIEDRTLKLSALF
jgi:hypothetical protein